MKKKLIVLFIAISAYGSTKAQQSLAWINEKTDWVKIGEANVNLSNDKDVFTVSNPVKYAALKLNVTDADVTVQAMALYYANGNKEDITIQPPITARHVSR